MFAFNRDFIYNRPIYWDTDLAKELGGDEVFDSQKTVIAEGGYYFKDDKLFQWLDHDNKPVDLTKINSEVDREIVSHAYEIKAKLKNKVQLFIKYQTSGNCHTTCCCARGWPHVRSVSFGCSCRGA